MTIKEKTVKKIKPKKLGKFLKQCHACKDGYVFAKNLTLEEFLNTCQRGDWILWLFTRMNPENLRQLTLAKGHCANTVRHLMRDKRSLKGVDTAIVFGEGAATRQELDDASYDATAAVGAYYAADAADAADAAADAADAAADAAAYAAYVAAADAAADAAASAAAAAYAAAAADAAADAAAYDVAAASAAAAYAAYAADAREKNRKETADICRKYLPLEIWNQSKL